jgi:hypothetical protein
MRQACEKLRSFYFCAAAATTLGTVFHLIPAGLPFFAPDKWTLAHHTQFARQVLFFRVFH